MEITFFVKMGSDYSSLKHSHHFTRKPHKSHIHPQCRKQRKSPSVTTCQYCVHELKKRGLWGEGSPDARLEGLKTSHLSYTAHCLTDLPAAAARSTEVNF